ncbi:MAG: hypothetical protein AAFP98_06295 [Pseudomonadota bacterium]
MTSADYDLPKIPLGAGALLADSFRVYLKDFLRFTLIGFAVSVVITTLEVMVYQWALTSPSSAFDGGMIAPLLYGELMLITLDFALTSVVSALVVQLVYDTKMNRRSRVWTALLTVLPVVPMVFILTLVTTLLAFVGLFAVVIGAFWIIAIFYVVSPVIVIERQGFASLLRSIELTKDYRWPIAGCFFVLLVFSVGATLVAEFLFGNFRLAFGDTIWVIFNVVGYAGVTGISYTLMGIATALVYARLREIKDGVAVDQIAQVFD